MKPALLRRRQHARRPENAFVSFVNRLRIVNTRQLRSLALEARSRRNRGSGNSEVDTLARVKFSTYGLPVIREILPSIHASRLPEPNHCTEIPDARACSWR